MAFRRAFLDEFKHYDKQLLMAECSGSRLKPLDKPIEKYITDQENKNTRAKNVAGWEATYVTHSTSLNCKRRFIISTNCLLFDYISHEHMVRRRSSRHSSRYKQSLVLHHSHACQTLYTPPLQNKWTNETLEKKNDKLN